MYSAVTRKTMAVVQAVSVALKLVLSMHTNAHCSLTIERLLIQDDLHGLLMKCLSADRKQPTRRTSFRF